MELTKISELNLVEEPYTLTNFTKGCFLIVKRIANAVFSFIRDVSAAMAEESEIEKQRTLLMNKGYHISRIY